MPVDPRHRRNVPVGRVLATVLRRFFAEQAKRVVPVAGWVMDLSAWDMALAEAVEPVLLTYAQTGYHQEWRRLRGIRRRSVKIVKAFRFEGESRRGWLSSLTRLPARIFAAFNLPTPASVIQAVRGLVLRFAASTNRTTAYKIDVARRMVREEMEAGLAAGEAAVKLTARVGKIFAPDRAFVIASTEASRAIHAGQMIADQESNIVRRHRWLASAGACPVCEKLNGQVRPLGEPFHTWPKPGPYQVVLHPPAHPHCRCVTVSLAS